jgi:hypothetical protein
MTLVENSGKPKLQLEVGKRYRNRVGDVVEIWGKASDISDMFPFKGYCGASFGPVTYTPDGSFLLGRETIYDLIEEVT